MKERKLEVYLGERFVGTMAQTADRRVAFAYSEEWLDNEREELQSDCRGDLGKDADA